MPPKRRRTKGSGSIILRGSTYWIEYQERGQRFRESAHTSDPDEAVRTLQRRIGEVAATGEMKPRKTTISDVCQLVVADYALRQLRDEKMVRWRLEAHIERLIGSLSAARFGAHQVRQYVSIRRSEGATNATINREMAILRRAFVLGERETPPLVIQSPHIPKLEESDPRRGFIEQPQYELLLSALPEHLKAPFVVGYHFGCRLGELRKLCWSQVDLAAGTITLEASQTKAKTARVLPIYGDVAEWLERQRDLCTGDRVFCFKQATKDGRLAKERPLGSHLKGWDRACEAAGVPDLLFHDLRRSAVRNMERAGIPRSVAMRISGHRTESVYRRYDIVDAADLSSAAEKMGRFASGQREKSTQLRRVK